MEETHYKYADQCVNAPRQRVHDPNGNEHSMMDDFTSLFTHLHVNSPKNDDRHYVCDASTMWRGRHQAINLHPASNASLSGSFGTPPATQTSYGFVSATSTPRVVASPNINLTPSHPFVPAGEMVAPAPFVKNEPLSPISSASAEKEAKE